ncbi:MAG TPA: hypothetical protein VNS09_24905 [Solirubrobacter sp.]|nr:hypothetical protein [Solirubrobacter sp.]
MTALAAAALAACTAGCGGGGAREAPPPRVFAFISNRDGAELERLRAVGARIDVAAPNWYALDAATGVLRGGPRPALLASARARGVRVWPVVNVNTGGSRAWEPPAARARLAGALRAVAQQPGVRGVTLDMEELTPAQRGAFSRLVREAAAALHAAHRSLAVYVARSGAAYDWRALGRSADLLLAAGYNESHAGSRPGPVTTRAGFADVVDKALAAAGPHKAVPLLGAFGYRWPRGGRGELIASADALALRRALGARPQREDGNERFEAPGATVVYQTAADLRARARDARRRGAHWIGLFSLGREPPHFWHALPTFR